MTGVYLSLGSNLGDRRANLETALRLLETPSLRLVRISSIYETGPLYFTAQPLFLNLAAEIDTSLEPLELLEHAGRVERRMGRRRLVPKGPRLIDIDIVLYGATILRTPELEIPHPALAERRFVLEPLAELSPDLPHPVSGLTVRHMLDGVLHQALRCWPGVS